MEEAAWSLGASDWQTFWHVILPPLLPALLTGVAIVTLVLKHFLERNARVHRRGH